MKFLQSLSLGAIALAVVGFALINMSSSSDNSMFLSQKLDNSEKSFIEYIAKFGKSYKSKEEYNYRLSIFEKNYAEVMHHNLLQSTQESYSKGLTHLADWSEEEYKNLLGYRLDIRQSLFRKEPVQFSSETEVPNSVDWRAGKAVTPVKN